MLCRVALRACMQEAKMQHQTAAGTKLTSTQPSRVIQQLLPAAV
jgi:hypothetical protein